MATNKLVIAAVAAALGSSFFLTGCTPFDSAQAGVVPSGVSAPASNVAPAATTGQTGTGTLIDASTGAQPGNPLGSVGPVGPSVGGNPGGPSGPGASGPDGPPIGQPGAPSDPAAPAPVDHPPFGHPIVINPPAPVVRDHRGFGADDPASAAGGVIVGPSEGGPIVRDHRGDPYGGAIVRDHRN